MAIDQKLFGKTKDGKDVSVYTITNSSGASVSVINFGGIITSLKMPDAQGRFDDIVLGYDSIEPYFTNNEFFGAAIGRSANRIAGASFTLDGVRVSVPVNENGNNLHTDFDHGFHKVLWSAEPDEKNNAVALSYTSPDGENGFPGTLSIKITYALSDKNELSLHYEGVSDKKTLINCTNHTYFNLAGLDAASGHEPAHIERQYLKLNASRYNPVHPGAIPTGECAPVKGTVFDFTDFMKIGDHIGDDEEQLTLVKGYDHNFCVDEPASDKPYAVVEDRESGRRMEVFSDLPGIQFYAGNCIREGITGKGGQPYGPRTALCLETQFYPNSVNEPAFESPVFDAGKNYDTTTIYKFSTI
ncbi:MAG: galactose mutarotase [Lachnospiraceae bacterium]|nr:galactose mutarotase [Lachnospiraceae bacterium]